MIVPADATVSVQRALQDLNERITALEGAEHVPNLDAVTARLDELQAVSVRKDNLTDRIVPAPGAFGRDDTLGLGRVLHEDGLQWKAPFDGILHRVPSTSSAASIDTNALTLDGSLAVSGGLHSDSFYARDATLHALRQGAPFTAVFGGSITAGTNANSGTNETTLPRYQWMFPPWKVGDVYTVQGIGSFAANGATKTLKLYVGAASTTLISSTTSGGGYILLAWLRYRTSTSVAVHGLHIDTGTLAGGTATVITRNAAISSGDVTVPLKGSFTLTGTTGNADISILDFSVIPHLLNTGEII